MEKKRARSIVGWRQVIAPKVRLRHKPKAVAEEAAARTASNARAVSVKGANERWEDEGGQLVEPAKP